MNRLALASKRDRADVFRETANSMGIAAALIEKDFWVCWTLARLFSLPDLAPHLLFKGGTALSKVYGVIHRFSEDVDISVSRDFLRPGSGEAAEIEAISNTRRRKEIETLVGAFHRVVADIIAPRLREVIAAELGTETGWRLVLDERDAGTLLFMYPASVDEVSLYNAPMVRVEMGGRSDIWPAESGILKPYAAAVVPQVFDAPAISVRVLAAERTFWEKATILHNEYYRPVEKRRAERISRHYYDLAQLATHPDIGLRSLQARDVLDRVVQHKTVYYSDSWSRYAEAATGAMRLVPRAQEEGRLRADYQQMRPMFFDEPPAFDALLSTLAILEARINEGSQTV